MKLSKVSYAKSGDVHIAFQVAGDGPIDLVFIPWWWNHVESAWDDPPITRFLERLASFSRLILFDQRGTGLSDPISPTQVPTLEEWMDDIRAVMDKAGAKQAALYGHGDGGPVSMLFAASHPERTSSLVLSDTWARLSWGDDYEPGHPKDVIETALEIFAEDWGTGAFAHILAPSQDGDPTFAERLGRLERLSVSPTAAVAIQRFVWGIDVRDVLPAIHVPTLVTHRHNDLYISSTHGQYVADRIEGARYVEFPGADHLYWTSEVDQVLDEVQDFLTGESTAGTSERVLMTLLFTDIVESTQAAARLGDQRWRDLKDRHDGAVRRQIERFRGREIKSTGDGILATFDGPARAIRCASAIHQAVTRLGLQIRAGIHTGECDLNGSDVGGIAVHIAARVASLADAGEVLVSNTVKDLVTGSEIDFDDRGVRALKGVPGEWRIFAVKP